MRYTIHGFSQERALQLKLSNDDLLLLRWLVDFSATNQMKTIIIDDRVFYWVHYDSICRELPIVSMKKDTIYRRIKHMAKINVLKQHTQRDSAGTFSYYGFGIEYHSLISDSIGYGKISEGGSEKNPKGVRKNFLTKDLTTKLNLTTKNNYQFPSESKPDNRTNFNQRDYTNGSFDSLYVNSKPFG